MKGDQMGTLTAHPSLQELSLSNQTRFSSAGPYDEVQATAYLKWDRTCGCAVFCVQPVLRGRPFTASRRFAISEARKTAAGIGSAIGPIRPGYQTWPFALRQR